MKSVDRQINILDQEVSRGCVMACAALAYVPYPGTAMLVLVVHIMPRPEKSLHNLVKSPDSNLHFLVSPERALHLFTG